MDPAPFTTGGETPRTEKRMKRTPLLARWLAREWRFRMLRIRHGGHLVMLLLAVLIGVLGGVSAIIFREAIHLVQRLGWGMVEPGLEALQAMPVWHILLLPALGGLVVGLITTFWVSEAKGHGVPEVMKAVALSGGRIRGRVAVAKTMASAVTIGTGGSCGREGPIIQIGAAIGSRIGQLLGMNAQRLRTLVGCGAAAGIAATFNAPVAGALFSVEVILGEFGIAQFSPIVISSVLATVVARSWYGGAASFQPPACNFGGGWELLPYALLGLACGLVSVLYIRMGDWTERFFEGEFGKKAGFSTPWLRPAIGGLMVGAIALLLPHVMGDGHWVSEDAFHGRYSVILLTALVLAKILATSITLGSGGSGGVFSPAICIGALLGALVGNVVEPTLGEHFGGVAAWSLVGMGGLIAGSMLAPITAGLMVFEITNNYEIILPVLLVSIISTTLVMAMTGNLSIYTLKLARGGVQLFRGSTPDILRGRFVRDHMREDFETVPPDERAVVAMGRLLSSDASQFYVVGRRNGFVGVMTLDDVRKILLTTPGLQEVLLAEEVARQDVPAVYGEEDLSSVLEKFTRSRLAELPVVEGMSHPRLVGVLAYSDVMEAYRLASLRSAE